MQNFKLIGINSKNIQISNGTDAHNLQTKEIVHATISALILRLVTHTNKEYYVDITPQQLNTVNKTLCELNLLRCPTDYKTKSNSTLYKQFVKKIVDTQAKQLSYEYNLDKKVAFLLLKKQIFAIFAQLALVAVIFAVTQSILIAALIFFKLLGNLVESVKNTYRMLVSLAKNALCKVTATKEFLKLNTPFEFIYSNVNTRIALFDSYFTLITNNDSKVKIIMYPTNSEVKAQLINLLRQYYNAIAIDNVTSEEPIVEFKYKWRLPDIFTRIVFKYGSNSKLLSTAFIGLALVSLCTTIFIVVIYTTKITSFIVDLCLHMTMICLYLRIVIKNYKLFSLQQCYKTSIYNNYICVQESATKADTTIAINQILKLDSGVNFVNIQYINDRYQVQSATLNCNNEQLQQVITYLKDKIAPKPNLLLPNFKSKLFVKIHNIAIGAIALTITYYTAVVILIFINAIKYVANFYLLDTKVSYINLFIKVISSATQPIIILLVLLCLIGGVLWILKKLIKKFVAIGFYNSYMSINEDVIPLNHLEKVDVYSKSITLSFRSANQSDPSKYIIKQSFSMKEKANIISKLTATKPNLLVTFHYNSTSSTNILNVRTLLMLVIVVLLLAIVSKQQSQLPTNFNLLEQARANQKK